MSTSTVSATPNPRRRTSSTINDVKHSIELLPEIKKASQIPSSGTRTRPRKPTPSTTIVKHSRPRWKTIFSVLTKNLLLLLVVLGLVQMIKKFVIKEDDDIGNGRSFFGFQDMEGRISSVESSMKRTSKMLQVQVEVLDKKINSEVGNLRMEIVRRVDEKGEEFEAKLTEFSAKNEDLETGLGELREGLKGFVSKDDVMRLFGKDGSNLVGSDLSLDEIRGLAREIVENEIEKHAADGIGRVDYALGTGGARVVKHSDPFVLGKAVWFGGGIRQGVHENAVRMLSPSFGEPGMCFAIKGSSGFVDVRLRNAIVPEGITLEHVAKNVAYDQSSAPKDCRVFGWLQGNLGPDTDSYVDSEKVLLAEFTYDLEKSNAQTIKVYDSVESAIIDTVRFEFSSNHGSPTHTCIYRLRVHGHGPNPVPKLA